MSKWTQQVGRKVGILRNSLFAACLLDIVDFWHFKDDYCDSSLYPTKNLDASDVLFASNRSSDTRLYLDSSLYPILNNKSQINKSSTLLEKKNLPSKSRNIIETSQF